MGKRGEGWFLLQLVLFAIILLAPAWSCFACSPWVRWLGLAFVLLGGILGTGGIIALGRNLTPFPRPLEGGTLVTTGVYSVVRHPIYAGLILGTLGWSLWRANLLGVGLTVVLFVFFDLKSRREERWLLEAYPAYADYRKKARKLIPWVY